MNPVKPSQTHYNLTNPGKTQSNPLEPSQIWPIKMKTQKKTAKPFKNPVKPILSQQNLIKPSPTW